MYEWEKLIKQKRVQMLASLFDCDTKRLYNETKRKRVNDETNEWMKETISERG